MVKKIIFFFYIILFSLVINSQFTGWQNEYYVPFINLTGLLDTSTVQQDIGTIVYQKSDNSLYILKPDGWEKITTDSSIIEKLSTYWDSLSTKVYVNENDSLLEKFILDTLKAYLDTITLNDTFFLFARKDTLNFYLRSDMPDTFISLWGQAITLDTIIGDYWDSLKIKLFVNKEDSLLKDFVLDTLKFYWDSLNTRSFIANTLSLYWDSLYIDTNFLRNTGDTGIFLQLDSIFSKKYVSDYINIIGLGGDSLYYSSVDNYLKTNKTFIVTSSDFAHYIGDGEIDILSFDLGSYYTSIDRSHFFIFDSISQFGLFKASYDTLELIDKNYPSNNYFRYVNGSKFEVSFLSGNYLRLTSSSLTNNGSFINLGSISSYGNIRIFGNVVADSEMVSYKSVSAPIGLFSDSLKTNKLISNDSLIFKYGSGQNLNLSNYLNLNNSKAIIDSLGKGSFGNIYVGYNNDSVFWIENNVGMTDPRVKFKASYYYFYDKQNPLNYFYFNGGELKTTGPIYSKGIVDSGVLNVISPNLNIYSTGMIKSENLIYSKGIIDSGILEVVSPNLNINSSGVIKSNNMIYAKGIVDSGTFYATGEIRTDNLVYCKGIVDSGNLNVISPYLNIYTNGIIKSENTIYSKGIVDSGNLYTTGLVNRFNYGLGIGYRWIENPDTNNDTLYSMSGLTVYHGNNYFYDDVTLIGDTLSNNQSYLGLLNIKDSSHIRIKPKPYQSIAFRKQKTTSSVDLDSAWMILDRYSLKYLDYALQDSATKIGAGFGYFRDSIRTNKSYASFLYVDSSLYYKPRSRLVVFTYPGTYFTSSRSAVLLDTTTYNSSLVIGYGANGTSYGISELPVNDFFFGKSDTLKKFFRDSSIKDSVIMVLYGKYGTLDSASLYIALYNAKSGTLDTILYKYSLPIPGSTNDTMIWIPLSALRDTNKVVTLSNVRVMVKVNVTGTTSGLRFSCVNIYTKNYSK